MMIDQLTAERVLYPLRFVPICQYRLWGGRRLAEWLNAPMPDHGSIGEPRPLQVEQALACIDFDQKEIDPAVPFVESESPALRERPIACDH